MGKDYKKVEGESREPEKKKDGFFKRVGSFFSYLSGKKEYKADDERTSSDRSSGLKAALVANLSDNKKNLSQKTEDGIDDLQELMGLVRKEKENTLETGWGISGFFKRVSYYFEKDKVRSLKDMEYRNFISLKNPESKNNKDGLFSVESDSIEIEKFDALEFRNSKISIEYDSGEMSGSEKVGFSGGQVLGKIESGEFEGTIDRDKSDKDNIYIVDGSFEKNFKIEDKSDEDIKAHKIEGLYKVDLTGCRFDVNKKQLLYDKNMEGIIEEIEFEKGDKSSIIDFNKIRLSGIPEIYIEVSDYDLKFTENKLNIMSIGSYRDDDINLSFDNSKMEIDSENKDIQKIKIEKMNFNNGSTISANLGETDFDIKEDLLRAQSAQAMFSYHSEEDKSSQMNIEATGNFEGFKYSRESGVSFDKGEFDISELNINDNFMIKYDTETKMTLSHEDGKRVCIIKVEAAKYLNSAKGVEINLGGFDLIQRNNDLESLNLEKAEMNYNKNGVMADINIDNLDINLEDESFSIESASFNSFNYDSSNFKMDLSKLSIQVDNLNFTKGNGLTFDEFLVQKISDSEKIIKSMNNEFEGNITKIKISKNPDISFDLDAVNFSYEKDGYGFETKNTKFAYVGKDNKIIGDMKESKLSSPIISFIVDDLHFENNPFKVFGKGLNISVTNSMENDESDQDKDTATQNIFDGLKINPFEYIKSYDIGLVIQELTIDESGIKISKIGLRLNQIAFDILDVFKVKVDLVNKKGILEIKYNFPEEGEGTFFDVSHEIPIFTGINLNFGIGAGGELGVENETELTRENSEWNIEKAKLDLMAKIYAKLSAGVSIGVPYIASLATDIYGKATAAAEVLGEYIASIDFASVTSSNIDHAMSGSELGLKGEFKLNGEVGAEFKASAFHIFNKTLYKYEFGNWDILTASLEKRYISDSSGKFISDLSYSDFDFRFGNLDTSMESFGNDALEMRKKLLDSNLPVVIVDENTVLLEINSEALSLENDFIKRLREIDNRLKVEKDNLNKFKKKNSKKIKSSNEAIEKHKDRKEYFDIINELGKSEVLASMYESGSIQNSPSDRDILSDAVRQKIISLNGERITSMIPIILSMDESGKKAYEKTSKKDTRVNEKLERIKEMESSNSIVKKILNFRKMSASDFLTQTEGGREVIKLKDIEVDRLELNLYKSVLSGEDEEVLSEKEEIRSRYNEYMTLKLNLLMDSLVLASTIPRGEHGSGEFLIRKEYLSDVFSSNSYSKAKNRLYESIRESYIDDNVDRIKEEIRSKNPSYEEEKLNREAKSKVERDARDEVKKYESTSKLKGDLRGIYEQRKKEGLNTHIVKHADSRIDFYSKIISEINLKESQLNNNIKTIEAEKLLTLNIIKEIQGVKLDPNSKGTVEIFTDSKYCNSIRSSLLNDEKYRGKLTASTEEISKKEEIDTIGEGSHGVFADIVSRYEEILKDD